MRWIVLGISGALIGAGTYLYFSSTSPPPKKLQPLPQKVFRTPDKPQAVDTAEGNHLTVDTKWGVVEVPILQRGVYLTVAGEKVPLPSDVLCVYYTKLYQSADGFSLDCVARTDGQELVTRFYHVEKKIWSHTKEKGVALSGTLRSLDQ